MKEKLIFHLLRLSAWTGAGLLITILILLLWKGAPIITPGFIFNHWRHSDISAGGIWPAIVGSTWIGLGVMSISFPVGLLTGVYLTQYTPPGPFRNLLKTTVRNLAGVPSVIYGLFGLALFVHMYKLGTSLISAILTLSIMSLPWIVTTTVQALETLPDNLRSASLALGATREQTILRVLLPGALPSALTGSVLASARALGETAPIIIVGATFFMSGLPRGPLDKFMALPYHTFILSTQHADPQSSAYASATALVLISLTFCLSLGSFYFRAKLNRRLEGRT